MNRTEAVAIEGRIIGERYRLGRCIGTGAYGCVYAAEQLALSRPVAVKLLRPELSRAPDVLDRFHREALALSRLSHPNVVSVLDYGEAQGVLYLVMELLRGDRLTRIARGTALSARRIRALMTQLLAGVAAAHDAGVVHADLKSDNAMVIADDRVKVVDFGIARIIDTGAPPPRTPIGRVAGTPDYMAPEVILGEPATPASDLYAAGCILYELLAGAPPFAVDRPEEALARHLRDTPIPPQDRTDRDVHPVLEQIAMRALAKDPRDRFASARSMADAIAYAADDDPARAPTAPAQPLCDTALAEAPTLDIDPTGQLAAVDSREAVRRAIASACDSGDLSSLPPLYLQLAALCVRAGDSDTAVHELEQALTVVASCEHALPALWCMHLELAQLYARQGRLRHARAAGEAGLRSARDADDDYGASLALSLIAELEPHAAQPTPAV